VSLLHLTSVRLVRLDVFPDRLRHQRSLTFAIAVPGETADVEVVAEASSAPALAAEQPAVVAEAAVVAPSPAAAAAEVAEASPAAQEPPAAEETPAEEPEPVPAPVEESLV
jgi:ribonuclease E